MFALLTGHFDDAIVQSADVDANGLIYFRRKAVRLNHRCVGKDSETVFMAIKPF